MKPTYRVWFFISLVSCALLLAGKTYLGRFGLLIGFFLSAGMVSAIFFLSLHRLSRIFPSTLIEGRDAWGLLPRLRQFAAELEMKMPMLWLVDIETPTSFVASSGGNQNAIFISEGALRKLESREIEALLWHSLLRIRSGEAHAMSMVSALSTAIVGIGRVIDYLLFWRFFSNTDRGPGFFMTAPIVGLLAKLARTKKHKLELEQAVLERYPEFGGLLVKLHSYQRAMPIPISYSDTFLLVQGRHGLDSI